MPTPKVITSQVLEFAIAEHEKNTAYLRKRYSVIVAELATTPTDVQLLDEFTCIGSELSSASAGLDALHEAHQQAIESERVVRDTNRRAAGKARLGGFMSQVRDRAGSYERLERTANAFIAALQSHVDEGRLLEAPAISIARDVRGERATDHMRPVVDAAMGKARADASAVACVLRQAVDLVGAHELADFIALNSFASRTPVSFARAHELNVETLTSRLVDA